MRRLLLLRHAKAVAGGGKSGDHLRGLNERGRKDAAKMATALQHNDYIPQLVLCSASKRTVETWEHVAPELDATPKVEFLESLYLASWKTIAQTIRDDGGGAPVLLVIGHNPGIEELAQALLRKPQSEPERKQLDLLKEKFPTAALAVIDFAIDTWSEISTGTGALTDFIKPKSLTDE